jgi:hypothetical protein
VDFREIWKAGAAIQADLVAVIFNPISSTILKRLRRKVVSWRDDAQAMGWDCLIVGSVIVGLLLLLLEMFDCWDIFS